MTSYAYDAANRTTGVLHQTSGSVTLAQYGYTYDAASNVLTRTDTDGTVTTFGYDASDQLTSEVRDNSHSTGYSLAYTYDHNHNRTGKTQAGVTTTYAYDAHDKLTSAGSKTYGYDLNGNCTSVTVGNSVTSLTYDVENRVVGITYPGGATNSFQYNGNDLRTRKVDSAGTKNFITDGTAPASAVLSDGTATYTPGLSERRGTTSKFYHADALGSTRGITDSTQATTDAQLYDAFGMTVSRTGTTPTPFGFVGKSQYQTDSDSGLQLLGHRYYDPSIGRFLSSDPAQAGTNWYAYCDNNPLGSTDPEGLDKLTPIEKGIILGSQIAGTVIGGFGGMTGGAAGGTAIEPGGGTLIGGGAGLVWGAGRGAAIGTAIGTALVGLGRLIGQIGSGGGGSGGSDNNPKDSLTPKDMGSDSRVIAKGHDIRDVGRLVGKYGGKAINWVKRSSPPDVINPATGAEQEVHWYENLKDGIGRLEFKWKE